MWQYIKKYFKSGNKTQINKKNEPNLKEELTAAEKLAKEERQKVSDVKAKIYRSIADIIHEIFDVPSEFWYEEYLNYEKIISDPRNENVSSSLKKKCDEIVLAYAEQLEITESKEAFYDKLIQEYQILRTKLLKSLKKISNQREDSALMAIMDAHLENVDQIHSDQFTGDNMYLNDEQFKIIKEELEKTHKELKIKQQVSSEIQQLLMLDTHTQKPYTADYKNEIQRLTKKLNSTTDENA